ncbi:methyltransferase domain-containing protein [Stipitochalara longipes BDJ]|nr:methyltransferase domain-containing protein [Stipitochalara longipes BDJ]
MAETHSSKLGDPARHLLETYSNIPSDEVEKHVYAIRDEAWNVWPYPCIGQFRFLDLSISHSPHYPAILERLKTGDENFLDLGCCFGQDLRKLAADGAPSEHLYGSDLRPEFFDLGYKLFRDKDRLKSKFIVGDVFDPSSLLSELDRKIDIIYAASFLHLFGYDDQIKICKRIIKLLKEKKDSVVLGRQVGDSIAGEQTPRNDPTRTRWRHNEESFKKMWEEVGKLTASKWRVEVSSEPWAGESEDGSRSRDDSSTLRLKFAVFREA